MISKIKYKVSFGALLLLFIFLVQFLASNVAKSDVPDMGDSLLLLLSIISLCFTIGLCYISIKYGTAKLILVSSVLICLTSFLYLLSLSEILLYPLLGFVAGKIFLNIASINRFNFEIYATEKFNNGMQNLAVGLIATVTGFAGLVFLILIKVSQNNNPLIKVTTILILTSIFIYVSIKNKETIRRGNLDYLNFKNSIKTNNKCTKHFFYSFIMFCHKPLLFYLIYIYFLEHLKNNCGYSMESILMHNILLTIIYLLRTLILSLISYRIDPIKITRFTGYFFIPLILLIPFFENISNGNLIFLIQILIIIFNFDVAPLRATIIMGFSDRMKLTSIVLLDYVSKVFIYAVSAFLIYFMGYKTINLVLVLSILSLLSLRSLSIFRKKEESI